MHSRTLCGVSAPPQSRSERKEQTRRALLDATRTLAARDGYAAVSLREITRAAGIVPTAFYRHFPSLDALGTTLVEDGVHALRVMLRDIRRSPDAHNLRSFVTAVFDHVRADRDPLGFLARERHGGSAELRRAIESGLQLISRELAVDLSRVTGQDDWDTDDFELVAELLVSMMADRIAVFLDASEADEAAIVERTEHQIRLVILGMAAWSPQRR